MGGVKKNPGRTKRPSPQPLSQNEMGASSWSEHLGEGRLDVEAYFL